MSAIEGVVAYQRWSLRGVPLYVHSFTLYYIIDHVKLIPGPHTDVTFNFGEHLMRILNVKV